MRPGRTLLGSFLLATALTAAAPIPSTTPARKPRMPRVVTITARRFEFIPNRIALKRGETVTLRITAEDVTHGFFARPLGIDAILEPGRPVEITITPSTTGTFTIICDHFCGEGHGNMHMTAVVE